MKLIYQLIRLGFLSFRTLFILAIARRIHGNNLSFLLKFGRDKFKNNIVLSDVNQSITFKELYDKVLKLSYIINDVVKPSDNANILLLCKNDINHILVLYALQNMGIKTTLLYYKTHTEDINKIIQNQKNKCYIFASQYMDRDNFYNIQDLIVMLDNPILNRLIIKKKSNIIFSTSGTTGTPKLVEKRQGSFYWLHSFIDILTQTKMHHRKSAYISVPISNGFGYTALLFGLILGKKTLLFETKDARLLTNALLQEEIDTLLGVPTSLYKITQDLQGTKHKIKLVISGGSPINELIFNNLSNHISKNIFSIYGSTEASVSFIAQYQHLCKNINALGKPLKGVKYKITELNTGEYELCIRSRLVNKYSKDEWVHTGDLVKKEGGILVWCGRKDDMILKNGVNIYPIEIENAILSIEGIEDVLVIGKKDNIKGTSLVAFIKVCKNFQLTQTEIENILKGYISNIKIPDKIQIVEEFEYTHTGKKIRHSL